MWGILQKLTASPIGTGEVLDVEDSNAAHKGLRADMRPEFATFMSWAPGGISHGSAIARRTMICDVSCYGNGLEFEFAEYGDDGSAPFNA